MKIVHRVCKLMISTKANRKLFVMNTNGALKNRTFRELLIGGILFQLCSYQNLVNLVTKNINKSIGLPIKYAVKHTAFKHFCVGENLKDCYSMIEIMDKKLRIKTILDHSVEESDDLLSWDTNLNKKLNLLEVASQKSSVRFIPIKATSLLCSNMLEKLTILILQHNSLSDHNLIELLSTVDRNCYYEGLHRLSLICEKATNHDIGVLLDAEQSYRQPAIEVIARELSKKHNKPLKTPILYNTYQMYLKRTKHALENDINLARDHGYVFAAKIVRGAYMTSEKARAIEFNYEDPVLSSKDEVDSSYLHTIELLINQINTTDPLTPTILIATHNRQSIEYSIQKMNELQLYPSSKHIHFAQILGMCDHFTDYLAMNGYNVSKLVCFGEFEQVLPWLLRRFQENQDILGAMQNERGVYWDELYKRILLK